jgi:arsenite oxidase small subunit
MERRDFIRSCAGAFMVSSLESLAASDAKPRWYTRARLVDGAGRPLKSKDVPVQRNLIFNYPFAATPCFLLNLGQRTKSATVLKTADARSYEWSGGTGANGGIVAYSAICAHRLTYPTRDISFISFRNGKTPSSRFANVIHCCSEHSQYDPADGARVLAGPAPQPLAAILLDYDAAQDELYAIGTLGGEMFDEFFSRFEFRLTMEHGERAKTPVAGNCVVKVLEDYCRQQVKC